MKGPVEKIATEIESVKAQMIEELKLIYKQLDIITKRQAFITIANAGANLLYTDAACTPPVSLPSNM